MLKGHDLLTFHKIRLQCEQGSREAWKAFLGLYTPVVFKLLEIYWPSTPERQKKFWQETLNALCGQNFERLRGMSSQSEREFLVDLRTLVFERAPASLGAQAASVEVGKPTAEALTALLAGLPFLHQEIAFFKLAGYSDKMIERMLRITPAVAQKGLERLSADYSMVLRRDEEKCLWPAAWSAVLKHARGAKIEQCLPLRQLIRILDGGISWYDKEPAEQHIAGCFHCLEHWTSLREVAYWRVEAKSMDTREVEGLLSNLPIETRSSSKKSFLRRAFGG